MGQEQSYAGHPSVSSGPRYKDNYDHYRGSIDYRSEDKQYKRPKLRRSGDSFKSDNSTESSGYRSGSRSGSSEYNSNRSSKSDYYCTSLYKNAHYRDINRELYKPVKIKEKKYKLQLLDIEKDQLKSARLQSYLETEKACKTVQPPKKSGIRNYTPKILSEEEERKKVDRWI